MVKAKDRSRWPGWFLVLLLGSSDKLAAEVRVLELQIKDHLFSPATIYLPAGEKIKLVIFNQDGTPEEFESFSLNREKSDFGPQQRCGLCGSTRAW